jgi:hypothetical protein
MVMAVARFTGQVTVAPVMAGAGIAVEVAVVADTRSKAVGSPNNAFERPVRLSAQARGQRAPHVAPSARLGARRPAAQRER